MSKRISQIKLLDHSKAKIELLEKYLERYLNIISNDGYTQKITVFDLFCGEGIYENGGEGSPIAILRALGQLHAINTGKIQNIPKIDVVFNDKNAGKIEKLKSIITEKKLHDSNFGQLSFRSRDYKEIITLLPGYIDAKVNEKTFVFIDPYGYKEIRASELKRLLQTKKAEILLFLPTQFMYRFDEKGRPQALIEILQELVDLTSWKANSSVFGFIEQFKGALKKHLGGDFFVDTFTIKKDEATVFCLYFFSSHVRGFEKMLEAKWQIDEDNGKGWSYEKTRDIFSSIKTNELEEKLVKLFSTNSKIYNSNVYAYVLHEGFLPKHATEVLGSLQEQNKLQVLAENGERVRKGAFYINYDNYKNEPSKVYFKIK